LKTSYEHDTTIQIRSAFLVEHSGNKIQESQSRIITVSQSVSRSVRLGFELLFGTHGHTFRFVGAWRQSLSHSN